MYRFSDESGEIHCCGEDEDVEEERGREELQTAEEAHPSSDNSSCSLVPSAERDGRQTDACHVTVFLLVCSFSVYHQSTSVRHRLQLDHRLSLRLVDDVILTDIQHQDSHSNFLLIIISRKYAGPTEMRKLDPGGRCFGK